MFVILYILHCFLDVKWRHSTDAVEKGKITYACKVCWIEYRQFLERRFSLIVDTPSQKLLKWLAACKLLAAVAVLICWLYTIGGK